MLMRQKIFFWIGISISFVLKAEGQITFQQYFYSFDNVQMYTSIQQTSDSGYILTGDSLTSCHLFKTDAYGNSSWNKKFTFPSLITRMNNVITTHDGGYLIAGGTLDNSHSIYLIKTNSLGDTIWTKCYEHLHYYGYNDMDLHPVQQTTEGGFILIADTSYYDSCVCVMKLDSFGEVTWSKIYSITSSNYGRSIRQTFDGGFIFPLSSSIVKTDSNGDTLWTKALGFIIEDLIQTTDSGFMITGQGYLSRLNSSGDSLWTKKIAMDYSSCISQTTDGGFIIGGIDEVPLDFYGVEDAFLVRVNPSGDTLWTENIGFGDSIITNVFQTYDGGYFVNGFGNTFLHSSGEDCFWAKLDSAGNGLCNIYHHPLPPVTFQPNPIAEPITIFPFSVSATHIPITIGTMIFDTDVLCSTLAAYDLSQNHQSLLFPNPVSNLMTISSTSRIQSIEIINVLGEKVFSASAVGSQELTIDCTLFLQGIFFVRIETESGYSIQKFIKE
jgi:hypothetical protein